MATIKTVLRPYKNNEGKQQITIRVSHQGKTCYHPTGEYILAKYFSTKEGIAKPTLSGWIKINNRLDKLVDTYKQKLNELLVSGQAFTADDITIATDTAIAKDDFFQLAYRYRDKFKNNTRVNSYRRTNTIISKLKQHSPKLKFSDIDISFIHRYELYLKSLGNSVNTINLNLSVIRTIYRAAISTTATINEYGVLYLGDSNGTIYAMSDAGEAIWYYETGSEIGNATAYADGHLYFATADGELLKVYDGWRYEDIQGKSVWASKAPQWGTYQGNFRRSGNLSEASVINSVEPLEELPQNYALSQNYPNPFNPTTKINYSLPEATKVSLEVYNLLGRKVMELVNGQQSAGYHTATFDASGLSSGVYLYKLTTPSFTETKKMLLIK